jgi:hypothetical protein
MPSWKARQSVVVMLGRRDEEERLAPRVASASAARSSSEPSTTRVASRTAAGRRDASRASRVTSAPAASRRSTTRRPIWPVGVVTVIDMRSSGVRVGPAGAGRLVGGLPGAYRRAIGR